MQTAPIGHSATPGRRRGLVTAIHPRDEMYLHALGHLGNTGLASRQYVRQGARIAMTVRRIAAHCFPNRSTSLNVLDFASGYGRATRHLADFFGPEAVWASDIQPDAVTFCRDTLGVRTFASTRDPADLAITDRFDLIVAASLFSHLPRGTFAAWLDALRRHLMPGGVLLFSVHGEGMVPPSLFPADGHLFVPESESLVLDVSEYGTAYVSDAFVRAQIGRVFGAHAPIRLLAKGLCGAQDLYIVSQDSERHIETLPEPADPIGYVDHCVLDVNGQLRIAGWAASPDIANPIGHVVVDVDALTIALCATRIRRGDVAAVLGRPDLEVSGFDIGIGVKPPFTVDRVLTVTARTESGLEDQLLTATLADLRTS